MKPKEKAEELIKKMHSCGGYGFELSDAKECAMIAVNELIEFAHHTKFWKEVKSELEKIETP